MKKITKEIIVPCSANKVWEMLIEKEKYEYWTKAFSPASTYLGEMKLGETIQFLDGENKGVAAKITTFTPNVQLTYTFIGDVVEGNVVEEGAFTNYHERYSLEEKNDVTILNIESDIPDEYFDMMNTLWDAAEIKIIELSKMK